jgi:hypothetical protein
MVQSHPRLVRDVQLSTLALVDTALGAPLSPSAVVEG